MSSSQTSSSSSDALAAGAVGEADPIAPMVDIGCQVEFVLGTGTIKLRDCLLLTPHEVLRLKQSAGSDLSVVVHGIGIATGEVVIIDDKTALRVSRVSPPAGVEGA